MPTKKKKLVSYKIIKKLIKIFFRDNSRKSPKLAPQTMKTYHHHPNCDNFFYFLFLITSRNVIHG